MPPAEPPPGDRPWYIPLLSAAILVILVVLLVDIDLVADTVGKLVAAIRNL